jgi:hypothetical protein
MRGVTIVGLLAVVGCAAPGVNPSTSPTPETVRVATSGIGGSTTNLMASVSNAPSANGGAVPFAADRVWGVMRAVFDSLAIPVTSVDQASMTIANSNIRLKRQLAGVALSKYVNCGNTQGFPSADTYEVFLSIATKVTASSASQAEVWTTITGQARPITFNGEAVRCTSMTTLEKRILTLVNTLLKA